MLTQPGAYMSTPATGPEPDAPVEVPGDLNAPDIVAPTGEEMPRQTHDEPDSPPSGRPSAAPARRLQQGSVSRRPDEGRAKRR
jgi:hypothetical protein